MGIMIGFLKSDRFIQISCVGLGIRKNRSSLTDSDLGRKLSRKLVFSAGGRSVLTAALWQLSVSTPTRLVTSPF